ncbi:hypothetical protein Tco_0845431 [Tanacetum coccineum]
MPALNIPVHAYSSSQSVGSSILLFILSDTETEMTVIPTDIPVVIPEIALEVEVVVVASPASALNLNVHLDSESNPFKDHPSSNHQLVTPVASRSLSSSSSTSTPPAPLQLIPALSGLPHRPAILVLPGQEIPFGRPYCTHPNGVRKMLSAKKRVHPIPARIPANCKRSRYVSSSSSPSPRKRRRVSPYSYSLATFSSSPVSVGPSRKEK